MEKELAAEFGVIEAEQRRPRYRASMKSAPTRPRCRAIRTRVYASMGNYIFSTDLLLRELYADAANEDSSHDFGRDILPALIGRADMYAYDFQTNHIPGDPLNQEPYWRDVGTIDAYYAASMDLRVADAGVESVQPPVAAAHRGLLRRSGEIHFRRRRAMRGQATDSIVSGGSILSGGTVRNSVIGRGVRVLSGALVEDSIVFDNCVIGRRARVRRAILDKNVHVPEDASIGFDLAQDRLLYHVTESGIVVVEGHRSTVDSRDDAGCEYNERVGCWLSPAKVFQADGHTPKGRVAQLAEQLTLNQ